MDIELGLRKMVCAVAPRNVHLSRRLKDGTKVGGPNRKGYGGRGVYLYGENYEPEFAVLDRLMTSGSTFIDVGANTGAYSLRAARVVGPHGCVLSLEPNPQMLAELQRNVRKNRLSNVRVRGLGASDRIGEASFWMNDGKPNSFSLARLDERADLFSILTVDLDTLIGWEGLDRIDVIKLDAEGMEGTILRGAKATIDRHLPLIIAEVSLGGLDVVPRGYAAWSVAGKASPNRLLAPEGHRLSEGFRDIGLTPVK